jgi:hypothetical protein
MSDFDWKSIIQTIAPTIATALGGPLAGAGVAALSQVLLGKNDGDEKDIALALQGASPEILAEIKKADQAFALRMKELDIDLEKLVYDDRKSAREREASVKDSTPRNLAYMIVLSFILILGAVLFGKAHIDTVLAGTLIGYASAKCEQVLAYYFGSSRGSNEKTKLLAKAEPIKEGGN